MENTCLQPSEPPEVWPDSIHGAALLAAERLGTGDFVDLTTRDFEELKKLCKGIQPSAV